MDPMQWAIVKMILSMGLIGGVLFLLVRLLKRSGLMKKNCPSDSGIKLLSTKPIAPQKYISLVEIGGEVLALGVSETQITFLTKIENKEFLEKMGDNRPARLEPIPLFYSFLRRNKSPKIGLLRKFYGK
jgi:flagellar protein FliO/FliZ